MLIQVPLEAALVEIRVVEGGEVRRQPPESPDERGAAVELVRDLEDLLLEILRRRARPEQSTDLQVHRCPLALGDERVGRLLDAIVREPIRALDLQDEVLLERRTQRGLGIARI